MKFAGIIAEYDPFHNGHAWQLAQAKALGAERVAVAMSCSLVQRGALPLLPEAVRTRSALTCGADLVFALPAPCACAGAEAFARAGVALLAAAGCDGLVFGAETPDAALLTEAAELLDSGSYRAALKAQLTGGARSFAAARQAAAAQLASDERVAALLDKPNNNLAVEYCRAIRSLAPRMEAYPLPRQGANHGEALHSAHGQFASASALRKLWAEGGADAVAPSRFIRRLTPPGSTPIFPPPGGASWPFSGLPAGAKRPLQTSAASPKDWSTVWKPRSVPAPPTTNCWTLSPPSATPGRGCAASPWTPRWAAPPTVSPPFRPISICWEGRRMPFLY